MTSSKKYLGLLMAGTLVAANAMAQNKPVETKNGSATVTISPATPAQAGKPLSKQDIAVLMNGKVTDPRVAILVEQNGVDFEATPEYLQTLRALGASEDTLKAIYAASLRRDQKAAHSPQAAAAPAAAPKEIKDQAEYSAYSNALNQTNPQAQAAQLESFLQMYPNTVVKEDALTVLLKAYQSTNDAAHMNDAAQRLLQINPTNITALALVAYGKRTCAETPNAPDAAQCAAQALQIGMQGMQALQTWQKPDPKMSDADFAKQKDQLAAIFYGAAGRGAMQSNNLMDAAKYFKSAADLNPNNLNDVYALAYAYLSMKPINPIGLFYAARAVTLAKPNPQAAAGIDQWAHAKYLRFHSPDKSDDHWADVVAMAAQSTQPPAGFYVTPAPTDREVANKMAMTIDPTKISIAELEYIFQYADPQVSQDVIVKMKGQDMAFQAQVIQPAADKLQIAATQDAIAAGKADVEVTMVAPIPAKQLPKAGANAIVIAQIAGFQANPFIVQMNEGKLGAKAGEAPKKGAAGKKKPRPRRH